MKRLMVVFGLLVAGVAQAAEVVAESEPSALLLVLAGVALIGTIAHRRNKAKSRL